MSDIENGKRNISISVFDCVCNKLWINICEFFVEVETWNGNEKEVCIYRLVCRN